MQERRRHPRQQSSAIVELHHPVVGVMKLAARDLSDSGLFAFSGQHLPPPPGTVVDVHIRRQGGTVELEPVPMRIVRRTPDGIALVFEHEP